MRKFKNISRFNWLLFFLLLFGFLSFLFSVSRPIPSSWDIDLREVEGEIIQILKRGRENEFLLRDQRGKKLRVFVSSEEEDSFFLGDVLSLTGTMQLPSSSTVPFGFSYRFYLWYHREKVVFYADTYEKKGVTNHLSLGIRRFFSEVVSSRKNRSFLALCFLGDDTYQEDTVLESYRTNGISHLFAISGMHFSFFFLCLSFFFRHLPFSRSVSFFLCSFLLFFYLFLIQFPPSSCRAFCFLELHFLQKTFSLSLSKKQIYFCTVIFFLWFCPFFFFDLGFQYSMLISFFFLFSSSRFLSFFLPFLVGLPLSLCSFFHVNFLSVLWNFFLIPVVTMFFFPIQILSFFCPFLSSFCFWLGKGMESLSLFLSRFSFLSFSFHHPPILWILLYYLVLFLFLVSYRRKRYLFFLCFLFFLLYHYNFFFPSTYFLMIDVGQGDALLFHSNNHTMLLDTGGLSYDATHTLYHQKIKPLLESLGIRHLDVLTLSHGDYDHVGEALSLLQDFSVSHVYFNGNAFSNLEEEIREFLLQQKIPFSILERNDSFSIGDFSFTTLSSSGSSENASSIVLFGTCRGNSFLLMGDASSETEREVMHHYSFPPLLFLKVGHHGSDTSSSSSFIHSLDIQYSLISVGHRYGLPKEEVLEVLKDSQIYRTDWDGSIEIRFYGHRYQIQTYAK